MTRRTVGRQFLLRPDGWVRAAFGYVLAVAARRHEVGVVAAVVMSNHAHWVLWDRRGRLPEFMRDVNQLMAKVVNATRGRWGEVWDGAQPHVMPLVGETAIVETCAYVLANPVAAGLVEHGREWPGLRAGALGSVGSETFRRPRAFFRADGEMPETATLELVVPPGVNEARFGRALAARVGVAEARARAAMEAAGRRFAGVRRVLKTPWSEAAVSAETRRGPRPAVAADDAETRRGFLGWLAEFRAVYRAALRRFVAGERGVVFPFGTYLMRVRYGVACARPP